MPDEKQESLNYVRDMGKITRLEKFRANWKLVMILLSFPCFYLFFMYVFGIHSIWATIVSSVMFVSFSYIITSAMAKLWRQAYSNFILFRGTGRKIYRTGVLCNAIPFFIPIVPVLMIFLAILYYLDLYAYDTLFFDDPGNGWVTTIWYSWCLSSLFIMIVLVFLYSSTSYKEIEVRRVRKRCGIKSIALAAESEITEAMNGYSDRPYTHAGNGASRFDRENLILFGHFLRLYQLIDKFRVEKRSVAFEIFRESSFREKLPEIDLPFFTGRIFPSENKMTIRVLPHGENWDIIVNMDRKFYESLGYEASYHQFCNFIAVKMRESYEKFMEGKASAALCVFTVEKGVEKE